VGWEAGTQSACGECAGCVERRAGKVRLLEFPESGRMAGDAWRPHAHEEGMAVRCACSDKLGLPTTTTGCKLTQVWGERGASALNPAVWCVCRNQSSYRVQEQKQLQGAGSKAAAPPPAQAPPACPIRWRVWQLGHDQPLKAAWP